ncbi:MAG: hypothetical protein M0Z64_11730 [Nitrospiraceae bacterium]|nr:hypothetical protein [Nitrospiraceae bacterium]
MERELVTCKNCGWVHFVVHGENASDEHKWKCFRCGVKGRENFRPKEEGDCPIGVTLNPVNWKDDE